MTKEEVKEAPKVFVASTGDVCEVDYAEGMTLGEALDSVGYSRDGVTDIRVNNETVKDMDTVLAAGDQVTLLKKIRGAA